MDPVKALWATVLILLLGAVSWWFADRTVAGSKAATKAFTKAANEGVDAIKGSPRSVPAKYARWAERNEGSTLQVLAAPFAAAARVAAKGGKRAWAKWNERPTPDRPESKGADGRRGDRGERPEAADTSRPGGPDTAPAPKPQPEPAPSGGADRPGPTGTEPDRPPDTAPLPRKPAPEPAPQPATTGDPTMGGITKGIGEIRGLSGVLAGWRKIIAFTENSKLACAALATDLLRAAELARQAIAEQRAIRKNLEALEAACYTEELEDKALLVVSTAMEAGDEAIKRQATAAASIEAARLAQLAADKAHIAWLEAQRAAYAYMQRAHGPVAEAETATGGRGSKTFHTT